MNVGNERKREAKGDSSNWNSRGTIYSKEKLWGKRFGGNENLNLDILSLKFILNQNVKNATFKPKILNVQNLDFRGKVADRDITWES